MLKEIKYLVFIIVIFFFLFMSAKYYFSDENKKNSYRSLKSINDKILNYTNNLPTLEDNTNNVVEYVQQNQNKKKKKYNFWKLLENNG
jgi:capsule polysaccharide export protein KpsE/RkpR